MSNIVLLTHIGIDNPVTGGEQRIGAIRKIYRAGGHNVCLAGIAGGPRYNSMEGMFPYPGRRLEKYFHPIYGMEDYCIGKFANEDKYFSDFFLKQIKNVKYDYIQIEMPWLFEFAVKAKNLIPQLSEAKLIYSSHNVEHLIKGGIYKELNGQESLHELASIKTYEVEENAAKCADITFVVSDDDSICYKDLYGIESKVAKNGSFINCENQEAMIFNYSESLIPDDSRYAVYVASAYKPNIDGFFDMLSGGSPFHRNFKLVIVGSAGEAIRSDKRWLTLENLINHLIILGELDFFSMKNILCSASVILLPILFGGGSSLKTADALITHVPIVTTSKGIRGFGEYIEHSSVYVADSMNEFKNQITKALLENVSIDRKALLNWEETLKPMVSYLNISKGV